MIIKVNFAEELLAIFGGIHAIVGVAILIFIYCSAPDMDSKYYSELSNQAQQLFGFSFLLIIVGLICMIVAFSNHLAKNKSRNHLK